MIRVAVEPDHSLKMVRFIGDPELDKGFEGSVDCRSRNARNSVLYLCKNLIHSRVIVAIEERPEDDAALNRDRKPAPATHSFEPLEFLLFTSLCHFKLNLFVVAAADGPHLKSSPKGRGGKWSSLSQWERVRVRAPLSPRQRTKEGVEGC
jgi:hypothetical protein